MDALTPDPLTPDAPRPEPEGPTAERAAPAAAEGVLRRETYFPTYIYFRDLPGGAALNAAIKPHIYARREADRAGIVRSNVASTGAWHSAVDMVLRPEYAGLVAQVLATAGSVFADCGYHPDWEPRVDNMWANVSPRHGYNRNHTHPGTLWSGVYYVQAPTGSGRIFFTDPRAQALVLPPVYGPDRGKRPEAWSEVYYQPVEGRMILFPSWLVHEVEPNLSKLDGVEGDRISVSFNIVQRRRAGTVNGG